MHVFGVSVRASERGCVRLHMFVRLCAFTGVNAARGVGVHGYVRPCVFERVCVCVFSHVRNNAR